MMKREIIRVEPLATYLERWKAPTSAVTRHGDTIHVSGFPPFDPATGKVVDAPIELVPEQMKLCLETAGASLDNVLKSTCTARLSRNSLPSTLSASGTFPRIRQRNSS
jgi:2-iminobutanoate/2-iminopropanoate deaminase